jgi:osmotically-inducible protein OsmY
LLEEKIHPAQKHLPPNLPGAAEPGVDSRYQTLMIKFSKKSMALLVLLTAGLSLGSLGTGCASTATSASTGEYIDDSSVTVKVKAAFVNDPTVSAFDVAVETFKGVVQLSGFVNTLVEKEQAGRVAATIKGVTEVKNNITIK